MVAPFARRGPRDVATLLTIGVVSLAVTAAAHATATPRNLVATAAVKSQLRQAHLKQIPIAVRRKVRGPLEGLTYYGSYGSTRYAIATFSMEGLGMQDQPELFSKLPGRPWRDRGDTGGCIPSTRIPAPLLQLWGFKRDPLNPPCFLP